MLVLRCRALGSVLMGAWERPGRGGGTQSGKAYRLRSNHWRPAMAKREAVLILYCRKGELSESVPLIFLIK